jgi:hypothetical protein
MTDPRALTLLCLAARDHALDECTGVLTQRLQGTPAVDNVILQQLQAISAERFAIAARRAAINGNAAFSPPDTAAVNGLQAAITQLHTAIVAAATSNQILALAANLLSQYGSAKSA